MQTSEAGMELIKQFEGVRLRAYDDGVGVWTIGVGHTKGVESGDTATMEQVDEWLREDLHDAESAVTSAVDVSVEQHQFDALVSLAFNIGGGAFSSSTLVKKLNAGDYYGAADQFLRWNMAGGRPMAGLTKRRVAERKLFITGEA